MTIGAETTTRAADDFLASGGEMGAQMRRHDWSASPIEPPADWPTSLRTAVSLMLNSRFPMFLAWGPSLAFLYNDAYLPILGAKQSRSLGLPFQEVWPEVWADVQPLVRLALQGEATFNENLHLVIERNGYPEDTWYTFSYSPIRDETGGVGGILCVGHETTETHLAQQRAHEMAERFRRMADDAPAMMWVTEASGRCTYLNRRWYEFTGQTKGEAEGFGWLNAVHPEDRAGAERDFRGSNDRRTAFRAEFRLRRADGVYRWAIDAATPRFSETGAWLGFVGSVMDIEDRKETEDRLRDSEGRFRAAVEAVQGVLWTNDAEGKMTGDQPGWAGLTGQTPDQYQGYGWAAAVHPADSVATVAAWNAAVAERRIFEFSHRVRRHADGAWRQHAIRAIPLFDPDGAIREWVGVHTDVTDLRGMEGALREGQARFRAVAEAMPGFVWTANVAGELDYASPRWAEYSGDDVADGLGSGWAAFVHSEDRKRALDAWSVALATKGLYEIEFRLRARDGHYRWWLARALPMQDESGAVRWVGSATDIHAIVEARKVLRRSRADLEARVEQRSAELSLVQEALRQSQKLEAMGELTGGVAHDFNNLLTPIIGGLDLLQRRGVGDEREQRLIDGALQSAERAKALVQRLLAFARRQPLRPEAVDIGVLVTGMMDLIASTSGPLIKVTARIAPSLPPASADLNQLEMALLNLSVNARDAMPEGGVLTISADAEQTEVPHRAGLKPGAYLRLSVTDTGIGMDEATLARAVEPFYSTKGTGKGTGLGLSMVHGLASQLGGGLAISSRVGLGTHIELWLPASPEEIASSHIATAQEPVRAQAAVALLVDDEDLVRASTANMLSDLGYRVVETASAEEALSILGRGAHVDVVVTDHLMPGLTGVDLARRLREAWPQVAVLIVSGYGESEGIAPDLTRLNKPFRQAELAAGLAAAMAPA